ncbi:hypothetical protein ACOMHN_041901 [Nucella lapillus]
MAAFTGRPLLYQVSVLLLLLATLTYCLAVALPWWTQTYSKATRSLGSHSGLWLYCSLSTASGPGQDPEDRRGTSRSSLGSEASAAGEKCRLIDAPGWLRLVQGMQGAGLLGLLAVSVYVIVANFCTERVITSRALEGLAGTGGALGIISATVYITKTSPILQHNLSTTYSWALSIDLAASILAVFISIVIAFSNRRLSGGVDEATTVIVEDCGGHTGGKDTRSRSPGKGHRLGRGAVEMERSPVRNRRLEAISEVFVSLEEEQDEEEEEVDVDQTSRQSASYVTSRGEVK